MHAGIETLQLKCVVQLEDYQGDDFTNLQNALYVMRSRGASRKSNMWHFQFFYLIEVLIRKGIFCRKSHLNQASGSKVKVIERFSKHVRMFSITWSTAMAFNRNKRNAFLFLAVSHNQCSWLQTDPARLQLIFSCQPILTLRPVSTHHKFMVRCNFFLYKSLILQNAS